MSVGVGLTRTFLASGACTCYSGPEGGGREREDREGGRERSEREEEKEIMPRKKSELQPSITSHPFMNRDSLFSLHPKNGSTELRDNHVS